MFVAHGVQRQLHDSPARHFVDDSLDAVLGLVEPPGQRLRRLANHRSRRPNRWYDVLVEHASPFSIILSGSATRCRSWPGLPQLLSCQRRKPERLSAIPRCPSVTLVGMVANVPRTGKTTAEPTNVPIRTGQRFGLSRRPVSINVIAKSSPGHALERRHKQVHGMNVPQIPQFIAFCRRKEERNRHCL